MSLVHCRRRLEASFWAQDLQDNARPEALQRDSELSGARQQRKRWISWPVKQTLTREHDLRLANPISFNNADLFPFKTDQEANDRTRKFLLGVVNICLDYVERENDREERVIDFYQPDQIMRMFDFSIPDSPSELDRLVEDCRQTLAYQVRTGK